MDRRERFALFLSELENSRPAASYEEGRVLLASVLNRIEDMYSGAPYQPENWQSDGRMYPPADDYERKSPFPSVRVFRTRGHYVRIAENGAIKITSAAFGIDSAETGIILDKAGQDGRHCP